MLKEWHDLYQFQWKLSICWSAFSHMYHFKCILRSHFCHIFSCLVASVKPHQNVLILHFVVNENLIKHNRRCPIFDRFSFENACLKLNLSKMNSSTELCKLLDCVFLLKTGTSSVVLLSLWYFSLFLSWAHLPDHLLW